MLVLVVVVAVLVVLVLVVTMATLLCGMAVLTVSLVASATMAIALAEVMIAFSFGNYNRVVRQVGGLGIVGHSHSQGCRAQRWQVLGTRLLHVDIDSSGTVVHGMAGR
jgi:hypothetical protein